MPVIITAKKDGFRRCGMAHSASAVEYADGTFTDEQLTILKAEPMLVVQEVAETDPLASMDKAALVELLTKHQVEFSPKARRGDLLALARALPKPEPQEGEE